MDIVYHPLEELSSKDTDRRLQALEYLRQKSKLSTDEERALHEITLDPEPMVAIAAYRALQAHREQPVNATLPESRFKFGCKGFGIRAVAYVIDLGVFFGLVTVLWIFASTSMVILDNLGIQTSPENLVNERTYTSLIGLLSYTGYFIIFEWLFGATPAKLILGMRVVKMDGKPCNLMAATIRAILRYIDGLFFALPAIINMKAPYYQRSGDQAAKTIVVSWKEPQIQPGRSWVMFLLAAVVFMLAHLVLLGLMVLGD